MLKFLTLHVINCGNVYAIFIGGSSNISHDISNKSFYNWVANIPKNVSIHINQIAPMLQVLGYDVENELPDYTTRNMLEGYKNTTRWQLDSFKNRQKYVLSSK
uniref:Uncharacterized protein n=1 Tax=Romanomermis culicivorax TaxID=13658 RepID=A0A915KQZ4_ROMCU